MLIALRGLWLLNKQMYPRALDAVEQQTIELKLPDGSPVSHAHIFRPGAHHGAARALIYLQHGLSPNGIIDSAFVNFAKMLALCGAEVIAPEIPELLQLKVLPGTVGRIKDLYIAISQQFGRDNGELGFVAPSLSAGMGLIALSQLKERTPKAVFVVGAYADFRSACRHMLNNFAFNNYCALVVLYNFVNCVRPASPSFLDAIYGLALDRRVMKAERKYVLPPLPTDDQEYLNRFLSDADFRSEFCESVLSNLPESLVEAMSPVSHLHGLNSPVFILHGQRDLTIDALESSRLAHHLGDLGKAHTLLVTPLVTHDRRSSVFKFPREAIRLGAFIGRLFNCLER